MIGSFTSSTTASLVAKIGKKKTFQMLQFSITIFCFLHTQIFPFLFFIKQCFKIMHTKFQANSTKLKVMLAIFAIFVKGELLFWAKGPQQGPKGPSALQRIYKEGHREPLTFSNFLFFILHSSTKNNVLCQKLYPTLVQGEVSWVAAILYNIEYLLTAFSSNYIFVL